MVLTQVLKEYEQASGQMVNLNKLAIFFGVLVDQVERTKIKQLTSILGEGGTCNYSGLSECFGGSKIELFGYIQEKLKFRLSEWFARTLSLGGKKVLLKSVTLAMPVYAMSVFRLPKYTCENITKAMAAFWWSSVEHKRKIHWITREKLCLSKEQGGLGFRDL